MKKIFTLILVMVSLVAPMVYGADNKSTTEPITLKLHPIRTIPNKQVHRAPMHVCVDAYYDAFLETITISYDGEATGEVLLYKD